jgi:hypothetical protein
MIKNNQKSKIKTIIVSICNDDDDDNGDFFYCQKCLISWLNAVGESIQYL